MYWGRFVPEDEEISYREMDQREAGLVDIFNAERSKIGLDHHFFRLFVPEDTSVIGSIAKDGTRHTIVGGSKKEGTGYDVVIYPRAFRNLPRFINPRFINFTTTFRHELAHVSSGDCEIQSNSAQTEGISFLFREVRAWLYAFTGVKLWRRKL